MRAGPKIVSTQRVTTLLLKHARAGLAPIDRQVTKELFDEAAKFYSDEELERMVVRVTYELEVSPYEVR